jgi:soluble lytic murein transglycosylase-like protein
LEKWDAEVEKAVAHWGPVYGISVDPALVHAVIERESGHGMAPNYILHGGVVPEPGGHYSAGPMQVYDDTLKRMNATLDLSALAQSPAVGIWYGTHELARLLALFPGDTTRAIAAYNAGSGNANRNAQGRFPNQSYVDAVVGFWNKYRGAIGTAAASIVPALVLALGIWFLWSRSRRRATA